MVVSPAATKKALVAGAAVLMNSIVALVASTAKFFTALALATIALPEKTTKYFTPSTTTTETSTIAILRAIVAFLAMNFPVVTAFRLISFRVAMEAF